MIWVLLIELVLPFAWRAIQILPAAKPALNVLSTVNELAQGASELNQVLPIAEMYLALSTYLGAVTALVVWRVGVFVYDRFPFKFT